MPFKLTIRCPNHFGDGEAGPDYNDIAGYEEIQFPDGYEDFEGEITCGKTSVGQRVTLLVKLKNKNLVYLYQPNQALNMPKERSHSH